MDWSKSFRTGSRQLDPLVLFVILLIVVDLYFMTFMLLNWNHGIPRGALIAVMAVGLIGLRVIPFRVTEAAEPPSIALPWQADRLVVTLLTIDTQHD